MSQDAGSLMQMVISRRKIQKNGQIPQIGKFSVNQSGEGIQDFMISFNDPEFVDKMKKPCLFVVCE